MTPLRLVFLTALLAAIWFFPLSLVERTAALGLGLVLLRDASTLRELALGLGLAALLTLTAWTATH